MRDVRNVTSAYWGLDMADMYSDMQADCRGSLIGALFQYFLSKHIENTSLFRRGKQGEPDFVAVDDSAMSFEVKTSAVSGRTMTGNACQAHSKKDPCFMLYVNYDRKALTVREVRLGWIRPEDWHPNGGKSQGARVKRQRVEEFLVTPDTPPH